MKFTTLCIIATYITSSLAANCNPLSSDNCPADPALGTSFRQDFTKDAGSHFSVLKKNGDVTFGDDGVALTLNKRFNNPTLESNFYMLFGKVEVVLKAAKGTGIVSSFYLQSDDLDEIDIELFGGDNTQFQSNYFVQGKTETYDRGGYHNTPSSPVDNYHTYTIDWTPERLNWDLDGTTVRTLTKDGPQGYPQSPMQIFAGIWAGGDSTNPPGTIEWAGGATDYSQAPFSMHIKSVIVSDFSSGNKYSYSDKSGKWTSIDSDGGKIMGREDEANDEFNKLLDGGSVDEKSSSAVSSTESSTVSSAPSSVSSTITASSTSSTTEQVSSISKASAASSSPVSTESEVNGPTISSNHAAATSTNALPYVPSTLVQVPTTVAAQTAPVPTVAASASNSTSSSTRNGITFIKTVADPTPSILMNSQAGATNVQIPLISMLVMVVSFLL